MAKRVSKSLASTAVRASFFNELATMLNAGLAVEQALVTLSDSRDSDVSERATRMLSSVRGGRDLRTSARTARLLDPLDEAVLQAAEHAGRVGPALQSLGEWHADRASRARLIKSRLVLPAAVLTLAAFVGPLPALVNGSLTAGGYVLRTFGALVCVAALGMLVWKIPAAIRERNTNRGGAIDALMIRMPVMGAFHVRRQTLQVLQAFEMLYTAGVTPEEALNVARRASWNGYVRESFGDALSRLRNGATLGDALGQSEYLTEQARHMVRTGDSAGTLTDMLRRFAALEGEALNQVDAETGAWIPRIAYALVAGWMVSQLL